MNTETVQAQRERLQELHAELQQVRFALFGEDNEPPKTKFWKQQFHFRSIFENILEAEWQTMRAAELLEDVQRSNP